MGRKDIVWVNNARAICILLVFLFHTEEYLNIHLPWLDMIYGPFFVNCFFFISGFLLYRKQLSSPTINENKIEYMRGG